MTTTTAPAARLWRITLLVLLGVLVVAILGMAALTASAERSAPPAATLAPAGATELVIQGGLKRPFPALVMRPDNPTTPQRVALGRLLYFDPVLSGGNEVACATCHHPDLGFTDGRAFAMGRDGVGVGPARDGGAATERGAPTVWNATYNHRQFWDGRAADLEAQALGPITAANEMNANPAQVEAKLRAIPEYAALFDEAFGGQGGSGVTFDNVTKAIAAFERTHIARALNHVKGNREAAAKLLGLSPATLYRYLQRLGLKGYRVDSGHDEGQRRSAPSARPAACASGTYTREGSATATTGATRL